MEPPEPWSHKKLFIILISFGCLLICLCFYKVSNLLYILCHIDDASRPSCSFNNDLSENESAHESFTWYEDTTNTGLPEMLRASSPLNFPQYEWNVL